MTEGADPGSAPWNPVVPGFHPDPSVARVGDTYVLATSTFEWWPGVRLHTSRDLMEWEPAGHVLTDPARLDLRDVHARAAIAAGGALSIDSDAHSLEGLADVFYGVGVAQRAWVGPERVLNTLPLEQLLGRLKRRGR